jgi:hypothetical protein
MEKPAVAYPYNGIQVSEKKEQMIGNNLEEAQRHRLRKRNPFQKVMYCMSKKNKTISARLGLEAREKCDDELFGILTTVVII